MEYNNESNEVWLNINNYNVYWEIILSQACPKHKFRYSVYDSLEEIVGNTIWLFGESVEDTVEENLKTRIQYKHEQ